MMKQFLLAALLSIIFVSITEARVQKATPTKIWTQPFARPQLFNVRQVLERTNGNLYSGDSPKSSNNNKSSKTAKRMQQMITGERLDVFSPTPFQEES